MWIFFKLLSENSENSEAVKGWNFRKSEYQSIFGPILQASTCNPMCCVISVRDLVPWQPAYDFPEKRMCLHKSALILLRSTLLTLRLKKPKHCPRPVLSFVEIRDSRSKLSASWSHPRPIEQGIPQSLLVCAPFFGKELPGRVLNVHYCEQRTGLVTTD